MQIYLELIKGATDHPIQYQGFDTLSSFVPCSAKTATVPPDWPSAMDASDGNS
jgi:hypothetical protein